MPKARMSYVNGPSAHPLIGETIGAYLDHAVEAWGDRPALVVRHQGLRWTYRELRDRAVAFAAGLIALGLEKGDRIGIWSPSNAEWVVTQFAAANAGLILVNLNPAYRVTELEHALTKSGCRAIVTATALKSSNYIRMLSALAPELGDAEPGALSSVRLPDLEIVIQIGAETAPGAIPFAAVPGLADATHRARLIEIAGSLQFDDPMNIQFTSGTTGSPKGATLTHHGILNNAFFTGEAMRMTERDRLCIPVPLFHCFGMVAGNLACLTHGSTMIYPAESFDPTATLETIAEEHCTGVLGVPTMFIALMEHPNFAGYDLTSLRTGIMAGSPCPIEVMRRAVDTMHLGEITIAYGMTETSPVSFQSAVEDSLERRVSTVGRVHPHVEAKIVDSDGQVVPIGTPGEFCTRGYSVMRGYWGDPEHTGRVIDEAGWLHTGDMAVFDDQGFCNIVGRIKDMVIRGGENIYPREVEEFLYKHPKIQEVQIFGVPDPKFGEELCAWIKLRQNETLCQEELVDYCRDRISHYKIPRYVRFVDEFPMTASGKMQKFVMRETMRRELGLVIVETA